MAQQFLSQLLDEHHRLDRGGRPRRTYKEALERFTHDYLPTLKPRTQERYRTSFRQLTGGWIIRPVQKSPSLTVAGSWLPAWVSTVTLAVSRTICFRVRLPLRIAVFGLVGVQCTYMSAFEKNRSPIERRAWAQSGRFCQRLRISAMGRFRRQPPRARRRRLGWIPGLRKPVDPSGRSMGVRCFCLAAPPTPANASCRVTAGHNALGSPTNSRCSRCAFAPRRQGGRIATIP